MIIDSNSTDLTICCTLRIFFSMQHNLRENFVSELAKIILRSDKDGDMTIDEKEVPLLALRLKIQLQPMGIDLDTDMFNQMIEENNDIGSILKFCGEVLYPELSLQQEDALASIDSSYGELSDDDFSLGALGGGGSGGRGEPIDFAAFCRKISNMTDEEVDDEAKNIKMTTEDKMSMFTVQSKYSKGSVEVSRGARMSVFPGSQVRKKNFSRMSRIANEADKIAKTARKTAMLIEKKRVPPGGGLKKQTTSRGLEL